MRLLKSWLNPEVAPLSQKCSWKPVINLHAGPYQRFNHAICLAENFIYMYGGRGSFGSFSDLWKFNIEEQSWTLVKASTNDIKPPHLEGHSLLCYGSDLILFGGEMSLASTNEVPLWKFNLKLHNWSKIASIGQKPSGRREHVAALYNSKMLIHGGYIDLKGPSEELWLYSIAKNSWVQPKSCNNNLPASRYKHSGVVFKDLFWISGGLMGITSRSETQVWTWNLTYSFWTAIKIRGAPSQLFNHASCVVNDEIFIFGGNQKDGQPSSKLWRARLDELSSKHSQLWKLCQFSDKVSPSASCNHCLVVLPVSGFCVSNFETSVDLFHQNIKNNSKLLNTATKQSCSDTQILQNIRVSSKTTKNNAAHSCSSIVYSPIISTDTDPTAVAEGAFENVNQLNESCYDFDLLDSLQCAVSRVKTPSESSDDSKLIFSDNDALINKENSSLLSSSNEMPSSLSGRKQFSYVNTSYLDSPTSVENEVVKKFSYNLSTPDKPWKTKSNKRRFQTTSFIDFPLGYPMADRKSSFDEKLDKAVTFYKGDHIEKVSLPSTFYKNASILSDLEQSLNKNYAKAAAQQTMPNVPSTLLLVGGCSNLYKSNQKEIIHMWTCTLTANT